MCVLVERIPNKPVDSNSFVIYTLENKSCIVVDPGTKDCKDLIEFLNKKDLIPEYIFLTHEHFDHIWGVNKLKDLFSSQIVCSKNCAEKIIDKKKNLSVFYDQIGFETYNADIITEEVGDKLTWKNINVEFISTPGHSNGSICISINNYLFTGDTLIKDTPTVIKLPGGSKENLNHSYFLLSNRYCGKNPLIFPGHGTSFWMRESKICLD